MVYTIEITNEHGCISREQIKVKYSGEKHYLPNIISSNSSLEDNKVFYVQSNTNLTYDMQIYNRWGSMVFDKNNLLSNDKNQGWMPKFQYPSGVYVYKIIIHSIDGDQLLVGDLTVIN